MPKKTIDQNAPVQNANFFLDSLIAQFKLKNDAALARKLGVQAPVLSKLRHMKLEVGASLLLKVHDATGCSIAELRALLYPSAER